MKDKVNQEIDRLFSDAKNLHRTFHKFLRALKRAGHDAEPFGYDVMQWVEDYSTQNPKVVVVGCDDNHFCSSDIVIIPHQSRKKFMGLTVMYIPQLGSDHAEFFLYPGHIKELVTQLSKFLPKELE